MKPTAEKDVRMLWQPVAKNSPLISSNTILEMRWVYNTSSGLRVALPQGTCVITEGYDAVLLKHKNFPMVQKGSSLRSLFETIHVNWDDESKMSLNHDAITSLGCEIIQENW